MTDYKRLTVKVGGVYVANCDNCSETALCGETNCCDEVMIQRLGELEDKIASGELREVPRGAVILTPEEREEEMKARTPTYRSEYTGSGKFDV